MNGSGSNGSVAVPMQSEAEVANPLDEAAGTKDAVLPVGAHINLQVPTDSAAGSGNGQGGDQTNGHGVSLSVESSKDPSTTPGGGGAGGEAVGPRPPFRKDPTAWYAHFAFHYPLRTLGVVWLVVFLLMGAAVPFFEQTEESDYDWLVGSDDIVQRAYALSELQEASNEYNEMPERVLPSDNQFLAFVYESTESENVLTPGAIQRMLEAERMLLEAPGYASHCVLDPATSNTTCTQANANMMSLVLLFYDVTVERVDASTSSVSIEPKRDADGAAYVESQAGVDARLTEVMADEALAFFNRAIFETSFGPGSLRSKHAQSVYFFGLPLAGYMNPRQDEEKQRETGDDLMLEVAEDLQKLYGLKETMIRSPYQTQAYADTPEGRLKVVWYSQPLQANDWETLSGKDLSWTVLCVLAVGCYIAVHARSLVLSSMAMSMILCSLLVAYFWHRIIFQVQYFQFINLLIVFVVLGIGADDVFVYMDAYRQSLRELQREGRPTDLRTRTEYMMRRASQAIFVTSLTTAAAFLATALSPLLPLRSFGIYSALVIIMVLVMNCCIMPPTIVLYARNLEGRSWRDSLANLCCFCCCPAAPYADPGSQVAAGPGEVVAAEMRALERFFHGRYTTFLQSNAKYAILAVYGGLFAAGVALWAGLEPPSQPERWFPDNHMFQQYSDLRNKNIFYRGTSVSEGLDVAILWGLHGLDTKGRSAWDAANLGRPVLDTALDVSRADSQEHLMHVYESLKTAECDVKACTGGLLVEHAHLIKNIVAEMDDGGEVTGGLYSWLPAQGGFEQYTNPLTSPLTGEAFSRKLCEYSKQRAVATRYPNHVGFDIHDCNGEQVPRVTFIIIEARSSIRMPQAPREFSKAQDEWQEFADAMNRGAVASLADGKPTSRNLFWMWSVTSMSLVGSVYLGMAVCFPFVFVVLAVSTNNIVLALYATATITGILTSVIGLGAAGLMGWDLGTAEAIAAVIVIGFSVDYCVHLANAYMEAGTPCRGERMQIALATMGISVTAGAVTTVAAGVFLFACILTFFVKFAFLICWTILMSFLWAVGFFPTLCMLIGPEGTFGDLTPIKDAVKSVIGRKPAAGGSDPSPA